MKTAMKLHIPSGKKIVLINHDDLGMNFGANQAFKEIVKAGTFNSTSVMPVCPWFPDAVSMYEEKQDLNIGVHLTLTSEWNSYKWGPLSTVSKKSGLIDQDGYFWSRRQMVMDSVVPEAAEEEFRAQIEKVINAGIKITHIDCHMGVGFVPDLFDIYINLGKEYKVPVLIPTNIKEILNLYKLHNMKIEFYKERIKSLEKEGYPLVDHFLITPCFDKGKAVEGYKKLLRGVEDGITVLSLHPNTEKCIMDIDPGMAHVRIEEYEVFTKEITSEWFQENNIRVINYRDILEFIPRFSK